MSSYDEAHAEACRAVIKMVGEVSRGSWKIGYEGDRPDQPQSLTDRLSKAGSRIAKRPDLIGVSSRLRPLGFEVKTGAFINQANLLAYEEWTTFHGHEVVIVRLRTDGRLWVPECFLVWKLLAMRLRPYAGTREPGGRSGALSWLLPSVPHLELEDICHRGAEYPGRPADWSVHPSKMEAA